jgi:trans-aconitate methyltransferase
VSVANQTGGWSSGDAYERYIGRWSRRVAVEFLDWLDVPSGRRWLDVGCGTGVLTETILARHAPVAVIGVDPSEAFLARARTTIADPRASFAKGAADTTGLADGAVDVAVAGLVLNFVPDVGAALAEVRRVVAPGGVAAAYLWDYAEGMELIRRFWDAAVAVDADAAALDQGRSMPIAGAEPLLRAFLAAGFDAVSVRPIVIPTVFADFDDLWLPFLGGTGEAPSYVATLDESTRDAIRERLRPAVPPAADGSISLSARVWAVRGRNPEASAA